MRGLSCVISYFNHLIHWCLGPEFVEDCVALGILPYRQPPKAVGASLLSSSDNYVFLQKYPEKNLWKTQF